MFVTFHFYKWLDNNVRTDFQMVLFVGEMFDWLQPLKWILQNTHLPNKKLAMLEPGSLYIRMLPWQHDSCEDDWGSI